MDVQNPFHPLSPDLEIQISHSPPAESPNGSPNPSLPELTSKPSGISPLPNGPIELGHLIHDPPPSVMAVAGEALLQVPPLTAKAGVALPVAAQVSVNAPTTAATSTLSLPSLGAWVKPPLILPSSLFPSLEVQENISNSSELLSTNSQWPSLSDARQKPSTRQHEGASKIRGYKFANKVTATNSNAPKLPVEEICPPALKEDGSLRYPWAAKMNPSTRNLYRTTTPTYMADGTPKVTIPRHLLLHGPENQKEYVIGQFYQCSLPPGGLIHAVVNRVWGRRCKIFTRKLSDASYLFHIPDAATRAFVLQRGLWHIDDCLMFVAEWTPAATLSLPEISTVPIWVTLKNIPERLYSGWGISRIASGLGEPMVTHKPRLDPTLMGEAKILVEVELDKHFPQRIALDDQKGTISMVDVEYSWIPIKCDRCGHLGHKESRCLQKTSSKPQQDLHQSLKDQASISVSVGEIAPHSCSVPLSTYVSNQTIAPVKTVATASATSGKEQFPIQATTTIVEAAPEAAVPVKTTIVEAAPKAAILVSDSVIDANAHSANEVLEFHPPTSPSNDETSANIATDVETNTSSGITIPNKDGITETPAITSAITETATIIPGNATSYVADSTTDSGFLTPSSHTRASLSNVEIVENVDSSNRFVDLSGALTGYVNIDELQARSRGGRPIKPSLKAQEMQWTTVTGRGNRGRGGKGGRGHQG